MYLLVLLALSMSVSAFKLQGTKVAAFLGGVALFLPSISNADGLLLEKGGSYPNYSFTFFNQIFAFVFVYNNYWYIYFKN